MSVTQGAAAESPPDSEQATSRRQTVSRTMAGVGLALLGGIMWAVAFEPFGGLWFLAPFVATPMVVAQYRFLPRRLSGLAMGLTWFGYFLPFFYTAMRQLTPLFVPILFAVGMLVVGSILGSFDRIFNERTGFRFILFTTPAIWTGWDYLVSQNPIVATEGQLQYTMTGAPILMQPISLLGSPALTYVLLMCGVTVGLVIIRAMDVRRAPIDSVVVPAPALRTVVAWGLGLTLLWSAVSVGLFFHTRANFGPTARMAAIQIGLGSGFHANGAGEFTAATKARFEELSTEAAADGAQYLIWPEAALDFDPREERKGWIPGLARSTGAYIQAAWFVTDPDGTQHNVVGLWAPTGDVVGTYNKIHPVLFDGEDFDQEVSYPVFDLPFGRIGILVCFDMSFYDTTRNLVTNGARIISASVGDWIDAGVPRIAGPQMRAAENAVGYAKGEMLTGSAMIDPTGSIIAESNPSGDHGESRYLIADVPQGTGDTLYNSLGDVFGVLCALGLIARIPVQLKVRNMSRRSVASAHAAA